MACSVKLCWIPFFLNSWTTGSRVPHSLDFQTDDNVSEDKDIEEALDNEKGHSQLKYIILDASGFSDIDHQGVNSIKEIVEDLREKDIDVLFAAGKG